MQMLSVMLCVHVRAGTIYRHNCVVTDFGVHAVNRGGAPAVPQIAQLWMTTFSSGGPLHTLAVVDILYTMHHITDIYTYCIHGHPLI